MDPMKINPEMIEAILRYVVADDSHEWPRNGTILVFLPGLAEIQSVYDALLDSREFSTRAGKYQIIPLHSSLTSEEQSRVFRKAPAGMRKIVLSTNISETSITIDDCVFVVDCGQMKEKNFDSTRNMESLDTVWISKANANQRKGRAGRVMPGICIHLFTSHRYNYNMIQQPIPEIYRVPLESLLLQIKTLPNFNNISLNDVLEMSIEAPNEESVSSAIRRLQNLGALDMQECLTALGRHLSLLPVDVRIGKLILFGAIFQCLDSVLTIAACLSHKTPFVSPFSKRKEADARKRQFAIGNSDHLTMLNAYNVSSSFDFSCSVSHIFYYHCRNGEKSGSVASMLEIVMPTKITFLIRHWK
jgi:ATP-dependent RNA helicase DHX57